MKKEHKSRNNRYQIISYAKIYFDKFFEENMYERLSDFYEELGEYSGASPSTIAQMRLHGIAPGYVTAVKIGEFLGVDPTKIWRVVELDEYIQRPRCTVGGCKGTATTKGLCMRHIYLLKDINEGRSLTDHEWKVE